MTLYILIALAGAVPLYFGFAFGRQSRGMGFWTAIGIMLSLALLSVLFIRNTDATTAALPALVLAFFCAIGAIGAVSGAVARVALGEDEDPPAGKGGCRR